MSTRVLVIPEDPTHNGYILTPLVKMVLADAGKPQAKVKLLTNPKLGGYDHAAAAIRGELRVRYAHMDLWLFFPDADRASEDAVGNLETELANEGVELLCCAAEPEVEIYACVAYRDETGLDWRTQMRTHPRFEEEVFGPLLREHGNERMPGGGRKKMTEQSINPRQQFYRLCPEIRKLRDRIADVLPT